MRLITYATITAKNTVISKAQFPQSFGRIAQCLFTKSQYQEIRSGIFQCMRSSDSSIHRQRQFPMSISYKIHFKILFFIASISNNLTTIIQQKNHKITKLDCWSVLRCSAIGHKQNYGSHSNSQVLFSLESVRLEHC